MKNLNILRTTKNFLDEFFVICKGLSFVEKRKTEDTINHFVK